MQCIWTSTSSLIRRQTWRACPPSTSLSQLTRFKDFPHFQGRGWLIPQSTDERRGLSSVAHAFLSTAIRNTSIPPSPCIISGHSCKAQKSKKRKKKGPSPAQLSRSAAQAIRAACKGSTSAEAFLIVDSVQKCSEHYSNLHGLKKHPPQNVAIDFGTVVPARLVIHTLLHSLLRRGLTKKAGDIARRYAMHEPAMRLSDRTLRVISTALCKTDAHALRNEEFRSQVQDAKSNFGSYLVRPNEVTGKEVHLPCTRIAVDLFFAAKQYQKQRAKQMFQQLMDACLLQGEILVASFLFAFLVKQWQARYAGTSSLDDSPAQTSTGNTHPPAPCLQPKEAFLNRTLSYITPIISNEILPDPDGIRPSHEEGVQALAVLAGMLHEDLLLHSHVDALVKALVLFSPSASIQVWTLRKGMKEKWERRDAREYFDEVLDYLVEKVMHRSYGRYGGISHWARVETFNSLLNYSLRRKSSPALAETIIKRMTKIGGNVVPNITTFNIVMRASTAIRRDEISRKVLRTLREEHENRGHAIMFAPPEKPVREPEQKAEQKAEQKEQKDPTLAEQRDSAAGQQNSPETCGVAEPEEHPIADSSSLSSPFVPDKIMSQLSPAVQCIFLEEFDLECLSSNDTPLLADGDTLAAYIDYLTVSGRAETVVKLVQILLPELKGVGFPREDQGARLLSRKRMHFNLHVARLRAVGLGPVFFTSALNALVKAGKTGLAERTWHLAKSAEGCSWDPQFNVRPWILPCAAYTIMMQSYAAEARNARNHLHHPSTVPRNRLRLGWGRLSIKKRRSAKQSINLLEVSHDMGAFIFRSRRLSEEGYRAQLVSYLQNGGTMPDRKTVQLPVADERFFNATLNLFGKNPSFYIPMRKNASIYRSRRLERRQLDYLLMHGCVRFPQDERLVVVLHAMLKAGYEIPMAYRHMLVGIALPPLSQEQPHPRRRDFARQYGTAAVTVKRLPTCKERGLPVRKALRVGKPRTP